jgi:hypothetical protein
MVAALPVQDGMNDCAVAAHNDLRDRSAQNTLARRSRRGGMRPSKPNRFDKAKVRSFLESESRYDASECEPS